MLDSVFSIWIFFKKTNSEWLRHIYGCPYFWRTGEVRRVDRPKGRKGVVSGAARATWPGGVDRGTLPETATRVLTFFRPGLVLKPRTSREAELELGPFGSEVGGRRVQRRAVRIWGSLVAPGRLRTLQCRHGEILGLPGRRGLLSWISGFAFAFVWLPGELSSEEIAVGCVDSTIERRRRCRGMEVAGPGSRTSLSFPKAAPEAELPMSCFVS